MTRPYLAVDLYVEHYHQFWYRWIDVHHMIGYGLDLRLRVMFSKVQRLTPSDCRNFLTIDAHLEIGECEDLGFLDEEDLRKEIVQSGLIILPRHLYRDLYLPIHGLGVHGLIRESVRCILKTFLKSLSSAPDHHVRRVLEQLIAHGHGYAIAHIGFGRISALRMGNVEKPFGKAIINESAIIGDMRITIVGCGSIGTQLAMAADAMDDVKRIYLIDVVKPLAEELASKLNKAIVVDSVEDELYHCDLVIEAASQSAATDIAYKTVSRGVDVMVLSVGAFVDDEYREMVFEKARQTDARVFIPSGALAGTDGLRAASVDELYEVELITKKGPKSLSKVKFIEEQGIDVDSLKEPTVIFSGTAREAVQKFPKNINVAATVSLLGVGFDKTKVTIVVDPNAKSNSHELIIKGAFGEMNCHTYNVPSPDNPKTSYLASLSAISALKRIVRKEWIGI